MSAVGHEYLINEGNMIGYMPTEFGANQKIKEKKIVAETAVIKGRVVEVTGDFQVAHTSAASAKVVGVASFNAEAGQPVSVDACDGLMKLVAASAITAGDHIESAADGKVAKAASPVTNIIGIALNSASTDEFVYVKMGK